VKKLNSGTVGSNPTGMVTINGITYFTANSNETWRTDGTEGGTYKLGQTGAASNFYLFQGFVYFKGGSHLYKTDGTTAGTTLVKENCSPSNFFAFNTTLLF